MLYIAFNLYAKEPLKIGAPGNQTDTNYSLDYIPGSAIRGAFIKNYIQQTKVKDIAKDPTSRALLLEGKAKFLNAYISYEDKPAYPFPLCFYTKKDLLKKHEPGTPLNNVINEFEDCIKEDYKKLRLASFGFIDAKNKQIQAVKVNKISNLHISKQEADNLLFSYEAIEKEQVFKGVIELDGTQEEANQIKAMLENQTFYIGGSKGSGYGKCALQKVEICKENLYLKEVPPLYTESDTLYVYALSDVLYLDSKGRVSAVIEAEELGKKLGVKLCFLKSSIETALISGYNVKWQSRLPQYRGIKAGSIFKYKIESGKIAKEKAEALMQEGIGLRTEEGYGKVVLMSQLKIDQLAYYTPNQTPSVPLPRLNDKDEKQLQTILKAIMIQKIDKAIDAYVYTLINQMCLAENTRNNQLGNIINLLQTMRRMPIEEGKKLFREYQAHLSDSKRRNHQALYQLKDSTLMYRGKKDTLLAYLEDTIERAEEEYYFNKYLFELPTIKIGQISFENTEEFMYQTTLTVLERVLRFVMRIRNHEEGLRWG